MKIEEIADDLQKEGELLTISAAARALNIDRHRMAEWLYGVPAVQGKKRKYYYYKDIARRLAFLAK